MRTPSRCRLRLPVRAPQESAGLLPRNWVGNLRQLGLHQLSQRLLLLPHHQHQPQLLRRRQSQQLHHGRDVSPLHRKLLAHLRSLLNHLKPRKAPLQLPKQSLTLRLLPHVLALLVVTFRHPKRRAKNPSRMKEAELPERRAVTASLASLRSQPPQQLHA